MQSSVIPALNVEWVRSFIETYAQGRPVLLAVSGGLDSMLLWDLVHRSKLVYAVAHVNYHLRGEQSELDARLVEQVAKARGVTLHLLNDHTLTKQSVGLQAFARKIRYNFFQSLSHKYPQVCTAHHADDQVETVLIQLGRGGGPKALAGFSASGEGRLRPLLPFTKAELSAFAKTHAIKFREDASNATDDYLRNQVRHHLVPTAEKMFDSFRQNILRAAEQQQALLSFAAASVKEHVQCLKHTQWPHALDRKKLKLLPGFSYFIHELLRRHEFPKETVVTISQALGDEVVQKRQFLNRAEQIRLVMSGQTIHLESTASYASFEICLDKVGVYNSPLGTLTVSKSDADALAVDSQSDLIADEIWVPSLENLVWKTTDPGDSIHISNSQTKAAKRVLAEAKLPPLTQHASSTVSSANEALWIILLRKSATLQKSEAKTGGYRLRFTTTLRRPGIIEF